MSRFLKKLSKKYGDNLTQTTQISFCNYENESSDTTTATSTDDEIFPALKIYIDSPKRHASGKIRIEDNFDKDFQHINSLELYNVGIIWNEVFEILEKMPNLKVLNLRKNTTLINFDQPINYQLPIPEVNNNNSIQLNKQFSALSVASSQDSAYFSLDSPRSNMTTLDDFFDFGKIHVDDVKMPEGKTYGLECLILNDTNVNFMRLGFLKK